MKHLSHGEQLIVCKSCGFQTLSLPVYKKHIKSCTEISTNAMKMSCELMNGNTKESHHPLGSKEILGTSSAIKPSANRNLLYCKHCAFSCSFSSQLISHIKKVHSFDNKSQDHVESSFESPNFHDSRRSVGNGISALKLNQNMDESTTRREVVLKKLKLEIPAGDDTYGLLGPVVRDPQLQLDLEAATMMISSPMMTTNLEGDERLRKCAECGFVAKNRDLLVAHKIGCRESNVIYSCNECEYRTSARKNFERHEWCHAVDGPFKCDFCSFSSNGDNAIRRHMSTYHTKQQKEIVKNASRLPVIPPTVSVKSKIKIESHPKMRPEDFPNQFFSELSVLNFEPNSSLLKHLAPQTDNNPNHVCSQCGLCYKDNHLLEQHIAISHQKFSIHANNLTNQARPLIQYDQKLLKQLEVPQSSKLQPVQKVAPRSEVRTEEVKKVYKCGYCNFSVNEFSKLREHMESNACRPSEATNLSPSTISNLANETVLQKLLLTNDNPNKVYPKVPLPTFGSRSFPSTRTETFVDPSFSSEMKNLIGVDEPRSLLNLYSGTESFDLYNNFNVSNNFSTEQQSSRPLGHPNDSSKTGKTYISCLLCTYKTLSEKVLRKHLIQDHPQIISSKRILREIVEKCINVSSRQVSKHHHGNWKDVTKQMFAGSGDGNASECSNLLLQMDVQCESENNPPYLPKQTNDIYMPFKCSNCGKRSNWKHIMKKHVSEKHSNASLIILTPDEAESTYEAYQSNLSRRLSSKMIHEHLSTGYAGKALNLSEENVGSQENLGMSDLLRLKRFKCSVCIYRSNFRCDISRHLKKRHPDIVDSHYTVMPIQEATDTLSSYRYTWPEAEALLLGSSTALVKEEVVDLAKIDRVVERKASALISRLPFNREDGKGCNICPFVTNKAELLRLHMAYHQPQKRNCYSCPHCPFFVNTSRLLQHHITLHENDQFIRSVAAERTANQQLNAYNLEFNFFKRNPKFVCEDCPYTSNNRNEFWKHRKGHLQRGIVPSDLKCHHCPYWAEDKRDWHLHCSLHGGMQRSYTKKRADLAIGEFCRCDLSDLKDYSDLACFKELRCPSCAVRSPSVTYIRHHMLTHMAFTDAVRHRIFDRDFDDADEVLGNLCTRLLNMNYSLAEECRWQTTQTSAEDEEKQMPVLEKVTEVREDALPTISIHLQQGGLFFPKLVHSRIAASRQLSEVLTDDYVLSAPEEIVDIKEESIPSSEVAVESIEDDEASADVHVTRCQHATTLFFLNLGLCGMDGGPN